MKRLILSCFVFLSLFAMSLRADVNSSRKVRLVYFVPSDRQSRESQRTALRELLKEAHLFFADQMEKHGYGRKTFNFEYDSQGEPIVHEIHGKFRQDYYNHNRDASPESLIWREIVPRFDNLYHVFFVAMDSSVPTVGEGSGGLGSLSFFTHNEHVGRFVPSGVGVSGGFALRHRNIMEEEQSVGGIAIIPAFSIGSHQLGVTLHELGHTFGLGHDYREPGYTHYIVGRGRANRLSGCSAEWLSVHNFFNPERTHDNNPGGIDLVQVKLLSENLINFHFQVTDRDELHQAQLLVPEILEGTGWGPYKLFDCQQLSGKTDVVLSVVRREEVIDRVTLQVIDMQGNLTWATFSIQPNLLTLIEDPLDVDSSGVVDLLDLAFISDNYGKSGKQRSDVNGDGVVDIADVLLVTSSLASLPTQLVRTIASESVERWLNEADDGANLENEAYRKGFTVLTQLLNKIELLSQPVSLVGNNPKVISGHTHFVWNVAFSPDSRLLASGSWDRTIRLWSTETGELLDLFVGHENNVKTITFSPDNQILASGGWDDTVRLWDIGTGEQKKILADHRSAVSSVTFSPAGHILAGGMANATILLWDTTTWQVEKTLRGHNHIVEYILFSPDGARLASASRDTTVRLWNPHSGELLHTLQGHTDQVTRLAFSPDGSILASGGRDYTIRLWDVQAGKRKKVLTVQTDGHNPVAFTPDGATLVIGTRGIQLWDLEEEEYKKVIDRSLPDSLSIAFSPDEKLFASGNVDHTVHLWDSDSIIPSPIRIEDVNGDGQINVLDLIMVSSDMGKEGQNLKTDVTGDGIVNVQDLVLISTMFD